MHLGECVKLVVILLVYTVASTYKMATVDVSAYLKFWANVRRAAETPEEAGLRLLVPRYEAKGLT